MVRLSDPGPQLFASWKDKVSLCVSLKSGYSQARLFIHDLARVSPPDLNAEEHHLRNAWVPHLGDGITGVADLAGFEPHWKRLYNWADNIPGFVHVHLVRDPLERLLSGFQDKCVQKQHSVQFRHCPCKECGRSNNYSAFVSVIASRHAEDPQYLLTRIDTHFRPQSVGCGSRTVGVKRVVWDAGSSGMTGRSLHEGMQRLCSQHGLPLATCAKHFPAQSISAHRTNAAASIVHGGAYSDPRTLANALLLYGSDYSTLQLPLPKWARDSAKQGAPNPIAAATAVPVRATSCRTWLEHNIEPPAANFPKASTSQCAHAPTRHKHSYRLLAVHLL